MKRRITNSVFIFLAAAVSTMLYAQNKNDKVHLKVTKTENGKEQVFEKQYSSTDEMKSDAELKQFDILVEEWTNNEKKEFVFSGGSEKKGEKTIIIEKSSGDGENMTWVSDDDEVTEYTDEQVIAPKDENGKAEKNIIKIKTDDGEENFTMEIDGDGDQMLIWVDEKGNKTELNQENIEKMISKENSDKTYRIKILKDDDENAIEQDAKDKLIEVIAEKEIDENGEEKITGNSMWIANDGKKTELKNENGYEFKTEGDKIIVKIDKESLESGDFSGGKFEGENLMVFKNKNSSESGINQTMEISIEEKNGEKFIDIAINRDSKTNVTISELEANDASFDNTDLSLKNNLKPSEIKYYPNPGTGRFTLNFVLDRTDEVVVSVTDILGKEVYIEKLPDFKGSYNKVIDLTGEQKGMYILQIRQKKKSLSRKILIE